MLSLIVYIIYSHPGIFGIPTVSFSNGSLQFAKSPASCLQLGLQLIVLLQHLLVLLLQAIAPGLQHVHHRLMVDSQFFQLKFVSVTISDNHYTNIDFYLLLYGGNYNVLLLEHILQMAHFNVDACGGLIHYGTDIGG